MDVRALQHVDFGLYMISGKTPSNKVASFDLGWTLCRPVYSLHHLDSDDWEFLPHRIETLRKYCNEKYTIAIFTNQSGKSSNLHLVLRMVEKIVSVLNNHEIYPWVYVSTEIDSIYHKPYIGMWNEFLRYHPRVDIEKSFFVGDSAGLRYNKTANDHEFAKKIGITFYTPEAIFPETNLSDIINPRKQQMVLMVGMPACGKEEYYFRYLRKYAHTNNANVISLLLNAGQSIVANLDIPDLEDYIAIARHYNVDVKILHFVRNGYRWNQYTENIYTDHDYDEYFINLRYFGLPSQHGEEIIQIDRV